MAPHRQHFPAPPPAVTPFQTIPTQAQPPTQLPVTSAPPPVASYHSYAPAPVASIPAAPVATTTRAPVPTQQQIDDAWTEHTAPNGAKYYHNPLLNESTYSKPEALVKKDPPSIPARRQWQEYEDPSTGKKYYSDGTTTTWEKPAELFVQTETITIQEEEVEPPPKKKKKKTSILETSYANKDEAIAAFKGLLLAKGIAPSQKWNEVSKYCSSDARWESFGEILSVGERRQALAEYQTKRANELKNQERQERIRSKEAFGQLLTEVLPTVSGFSAWSSRFADIRAALAKDDRFHAVADEDTRESLFLEFCEELRKREERKKRNKKRDAQDSYNAFLGEKEEAGKLTFASTWDLFLLSLSDEEKDDPRFCTSHNLTESDKQLYFADFVIELQAAEDDKRRRIRDARRRAEKAQREAYRDVLKRLARDGTIRPYTRWRSIEEFVMVDPAFNAVLAQDREAPREMYEEFIDEWDDLYRQERAFLSRLINPPDKAEITVYPGISLDDFAKLLLKEADFSSDIYADTSRIINREEPVSSVRLYLEELVSRANHSSLRPSNPRRASQEDSSEDEGEILEEDEVDPLDVSAGTAAREDDTNITGTIQREELQLVDGTDTAVIASDSQTVPTATFLNDETDSNMITSESTQQVEVETNSKTIGEHNEEV